MAGYGFASNPPYGLMEFLNVLGQDVEVTVKPATRRKAGNMSVVMRA
jgi:hypothetical protein